MNAYVSQVSQPLLCLVPLAELTFDFVPPVVVNRNNL